MKREFRAHLRRTVLAPTHRSTFEEACGREPALAAHAAIITVLAFLTEEGDARYAERDALALALIREQQRAPSQLWTSTLLIAFAPMLLRLRGRIAGNDVPRDELDMLVVEVFLDIVQHYPLSRPHGRTALLLRQDTQRALFRLLNLERARAESSTELDFDEMEIWPLGDFVASEHVAEADAEDREEMRRILRERAALVVDDDRLEVIDATLVSGETLGAVVARRHPELGAEARRMAYERLKRERHRTVAKLRRVFARDADGDERDAPPASARERRGHRRRKGSAAAKNSLE